MFSEFSLFARPLNEIPAGRCLINTINAHSYTVARVDGLFREALLKSDILIPDGISVVWAARWLTGARLKKIAGEDLFFYEMTRLQQCHGRAFFLGSSEATLVKIRDRVRRDYPDVAVDSYAPPFKPAFSSEDDDAMLAAINAFQPDVLFVGMTAPKQEKWAYAHFHELEAGHVCCIGAVFDFYAGTVRRAPRWLIRLGLEWFYRLVSEPLRMWRRYLLGNTLFIWAILREKYHW